MTIQATCPKGHTLTVEEKLAGKKIRCPRCQAVFEVPDPDDDDDDDEAVSEKPLRKGGRRGRDDDDEDDDDRPRGRARAAAARDDDDDDEYEDDDDDKLSPEERRKLEKLEKRKALKLVDIGLLLWYIKLMIIVIGMLIGMAAVVLFVIARAQTTEAIGVAAGKDVQPVQPGGGFVLFGAVTIFIALMFLLNLAMGLIAPLLGLVGSFLCCWTPKKSGAKGTIIISLTFDLICMTVWLLALLAELNVFGMEPHKTANLLYLLHAVKTISVIIAWLTFLTYLRGLGVYLGEPGVGNEALNLIARLVVQVISLIFNIASNIALAILLGGIIAIMLMVLFVLVWFVFFVFGFYLRMLKLVGAMRRAVQNKL